MFMFDVGVMTTTTALGLLICTAITSLVARFVLKLSCNICWNVWSGIKDLLIVCFLCFNPCSSHKLSFAALPYTASSWWLLLHLRYHHGGNSWLLSPCELPARSALHVTARKSGLNFLLFTSDALKPADSWRRLLSEIGVFLALYYSVSIFKIQKYTHMFCILKMGIE